MTAMILDKALERRIVADRRRRGIDRWDEVWEGVYVMSPAPDIEHMDVSADLVSVLRDVVRTDGLGECFPAVNISDRKTNWRKNYRCPDAAVFLSGNPAEDCETHWFGGPDLAIEIVSPKDRTRKKIPFYESVGTRELLIVDRRPWQLTLYRLMDNKLRPIGQSSHPDAQTLASNVVPLSFQLTQMGDRPGILIRHVHDQRQWTVEARQTKSK